MSTGICFAAEVHAAEVAQGDVGKAGYEAYCQSCHQPDGQGMAGVFPPLAGSDYLLEDTDRGILAVLQGVSGPIEVNGDTPTTPLCRTWQLSGSDENIAAILNYVLSNSLG